jgi:glycerol-3-phosphate dehydrogenase
MMKQTNADIIILGGGIAGLFTLNRLRALGYSALLLEADRLGAGQTIKSQGIIHGGIKFALKGFLTGSANAVETMPKRWKDCLQGKGELDLSAVKILSNDQLLWSTGSLSSELTAFFASQALSSRVQKLATAHYPEVFKNASFKGQIWRLDEVVLDPSSLIQSLRSAHESHIYKIGANDLKIVYDNNNNIQALQLLSEEKTKTLHLSAQHYLFTAGEGNTQLLTDYYQPPAMQCRPLQMVVVKLKQPYPLFAHCIDHGVNPRITITSHLACDGSWVWYLGGQIAEEGVHKTKDEQIKFAKQELQSLFPWLDFSAAQWASFFINRAEAKQPDGKRPDTVSVKTENNFTVAWPTKLALAPLLADQVIDCLKNRAVEPSQQTAELIPDLAKPENALPVWEELF